ncbi:hypothetical protein ACLKA7_001629 [Drosophila subpalustris]
MNTEQHKRFGIKRHQKQLHSRLNMPLEPPAKNVDTAATTAELMQLFDVENGGFDDTLVLTLTEQEIRLFADLYDEVQCENRAERASTKEEHEWKRRSMLGI